MMPPGVYKVCTDVHTDWMYSSGRRHLQRNLSPTLLIKKFVLFQLTSVGKPQALEDINSFYVFKHYKAVKGNYFCLQFSCFPVL